MPGSLLLPTYSESLESLRFYLRSSTNIILNTTMPTRIPHCTYQGNICSRAFGKDKKEVFCCGCFGTPLLDWFLLILNAFFNFMWIVFFSEFLIWRRVINLITIIYFPKLFLWCKIIYCGIINLFLGLTWADLISDHLIILFRFLKWANQVFIFFFCR